MRATHGESFGNDNRTPEYVAWTNMIQRCENDSLSYFGNYGGRGIRVCDGWRGSFEAFLRDVGRRPSAAHSLDRYPDNDGDYEPGNVRWATGSQQARNRRDTRRITAYGETMCLQEWAHTMGLAREMIAHRIDAGWSAEEAVTTSPMVAITFSFHGEHLTLLELVERTGIPQSSLHRRLRRHDGNADAAVAGYFSNGRGRRNLKKAA